MTVSGVEHSPCSGHHPLQLVITPAECSAYLSKLWATAEQACMKALDSHVLLLNPCKAYLQNSLPHDYKPYGARCQTRLPCRFLNVMANTLTSLPDEVCELPALYRLGLKANALTQLPAGLGRLTSLVELFLTDNK